jgi:hypothetical protein
VCFHLYFVPWQSPCAAEQNQAVEAPAAAYGIDLGIGVAQMGEWKCLWVYPEVAQESGHGRFDLGSCERKARAGPLRLTQNFMGRWLNWHYI